MWPMWGIQVARRLRRPGQGPLGPKSKQQWVECAKLAKSTKLAPWAMLTQLELNQLTH